MKAKFAIFLTSFFLISSSGLFAQTITLDKIELDNKLALIPFSAEISDKVPSDKTKWVSFMAHYKVDMRNVKPKSLIDNGKWLDDVEVTWEMLYKPVEARDKIQNYVKCVKKIKYKNVTEGQHTSVVFIDPRTLARYFNEGKSNFMRGLKLRFSMKVGGKTVKNMTSYIVSATEDKKQQYKKVFDSEDPYPLEGILLNRNETPFKYSQTWYFNTIVEEDK